MLLLLLLLLLPWRCSITCRAWRGLLAEVTRTLSENWLIMMPRLLLLIRWMHGAPSCLLSPISIFGPHRSTMYIDAAYCYRPSSVVCLSFCLSWSWALQKWLNRSRWCLGCGLPMNHALDGVQILHGKEQFWRGKGRLLVKYRVSIHPCRILPLSSSSGFKWAAG